MDIDARDGKVRVCYGERLFSLINEVRQISSLGFEIPSKIGKCVEMGKRFYQCGVDLQSVSEERRAISSKLRVSSGRALLQHDRLGNDSESTTDDDRLGEDVRAFDSRSEISE